MSTSRTRDSIFRFFCFVSVALGSLDDEAEGGARASREETLLTLVRDLVAVGDRETRAGFLDCGGSPPTSSCRFRVRKSFSAKLVNTSLFCFESEVATSLAMEDVATESGVSAMMISGMCLRLGLGVGHLSSTYFTSVYPALRGMM